MSIVGILAYGSLIEDPGKEIKPLIRERREGVETPFRVEFARSSSKRSGAPTLVPVDTGGSPVRAMILVLDAAINLENAEDLLWRRETRNECSDKHYTRPARSDPNRLVVERLETFAGLDIVLYAKFGRNIEDLSAPALAKLAIASAKGEVGKAERDGISYLISVKRQGISTPLMPEYEREVLKRSGASSLKEASAMCRGVNGPYVEGRG